MMMKDFPEGLEEFLQYLVANGSMPNTHIDGKTFGNKMKKVLTTTITNLSKLDSLKELSSNDLLQTFWRTFELDIYTVLNEAGPDVFEICDWWFYKIKTECMRGSPIDTIFQNVQTKLAETLHSQDKKGIEDWCGEFFTSMCHHLTSLCCKQSGDYWDFTTMGSLTGRAPKRVVHV
jgi:hypothetical protein